MRIQPIGNGFRLTVLIFPDGLTPNQLADRVRNHAIRLRRSLCVEPDPDEESRRRLLWQSDQPEARQRHELVQRVSPARRDSRRNFTPWQKQVLVLRSGGVCCRCAVELGPNWQADHRTPWSQGGRTEVDNGQALCCRCNFEKGAD